MVEALDILHLLAGGRDLGDFAFQELMPSLKCSQLLPEVRALSLNWTVVKCDAAWSNQTLMILKHHQSSIFHSYFEYFLLDILYITHAYLYNRRWTVWGFGETELLKILPMYLGRWVWQVPALLPAIKVGIVRPSNGPCNFPVRCSAFFLRRCCSTWSSSRVSYCIFSSSSTLSFNATSSWWAFRNQNWKERSSTLSRSQAS